MASFAMLAHCAADDEITSIPVGGGAEPAGASTSGSEPESMGPGDPGASAPTDPSDGDGGAPADDVDASPPPGGADAGPNKAAWFGAARCANSGLAFCDSFEAASIDTNRWTIEKNGSNTVTLDTTQHARGNKALKLHFVGNTNFQYAWLSTLKPFDQTPALQTHVFGRLFYKIDKVPTKAMHWTTIEVDGPLANGTNARLRYGGEYDNFMANYVTGAGEMGKFSKTAFPVNQWTCLEWEYEKSTNTMRLWSDETLISDAEVTDPKWIHPKYDKLYVGWQNYQPNLVVPMNVWVDDVAVNAARIGCTK
jgi:hypothetical protein